MPVSFDSAELEATDRLLAQAADTATSPPTTLWASELSEDAVAVGAIDLTDDAESADGDGSNGGASGPSGAGGLDAADTVTLVPVVDWTQVGNGSTTS